jgi:putative membrane protein
LMQKLRAYNPFSTGVLRQIWTVLVVWFAVWALVGVFVVSLNLDLPGGSFADVLFLSLASVILFLEELKERGRLWAMAAFLWVALFSGAVEAVGATTGWPFGAYSYTSAFGYQIGGVLPVSVPLAWWVVILPLYGMARMRAPTGVFTKLILVPVFVATAAVWTDLLLEPVAWDKRGYWIWVENGPYYGVPVQNFAGWFGTAFILSLGLLILEVLNGHFSKPYRMRAVQVLVLLVVLTTFVAAALSGRYWVAALIGGALIVFLAGSLRLGRPPGSAGVQ